MKNSQLAKCGQTQHSRLQALAGVFSCCIVISKSFSFSWTFADVRPNRPMEGKIILKEHSFFMPGGGRKQVTFFIRNNERF